MKTSQMVLFAAASLSLSLSSLVFLTACGPGQDPPNPVPAADAGPDAPADAATDGAKPAEDAGSSDAASSSD